MIGAGNTIVYMKFGSHLYGTDTPQSDLDFKGIFMPELKDILLGRIPKAYSSNTKVGSEEKNSKDDKDSDMYSLHHFVKLACAGETVTIDMIHAPANMILSTSEIWKKITDNKERIYSKNMTAIVGYARGQAAKYGVKGSRLNAAKSVVDLLESVDSNLLLRDVWDTLPMGEHIEKKGDWYIVCQKQFPKMSRVGYNLDIIRKFYDNYGKRARMAANNEGIDWKAVSHALRVCYQMLEIVETRNIVYPLKDAIFLREVKLGQHPYNTIGKLLDDLLDEVNEKTVNSDLPDKIDFKWWDDLLEKTVYDYYFDNKKETK